MKVNEKIVNNRSAGDTVLLYNSQEGLQNFNNAIWPKDKLKKRKQS